MAARRVAGALLAGVLLVLLAAKLPAKKHRSLLVNNAPAAEESALERGLVSENVHYKSILFEHSRHWENTEHRHFSGMVLAYVTPWNRKGYEVALKFRSKFTHVSPVWYQMQSQQGRVALAGGDGVDKAWVLKLKQGGATTKLVPRVVLEGGQLKEMLEDPELQQESIDLLLAECEARGYDGLVLEAWSQWAGAGVLNAADLREKAVEYLKALAQALSGRARPMELIVVVPPPSGGGSSGHVFTAHDVTYLAPFVAGFSVMTYDFSNAYRPGPNAPLPWVRAVLQYLLPHVKPPHEEAPEEEEHHGRELRSLDNGEQDEIAAKILLGLNFYGNKYEHPRGGGPIVGYEYLDIVDKHRPSIKWDDTAKEHYFAYTTSTGTKHQVYYPTLQSIKVRLDEARAWGTGISIWEVGQGLDIFYDLL